MLSGHPLATSMDVFSFAGILLYVFNQKWPRISVLRKFNPRGVTLSEIEKRQEHLEKIEAEFSVLKSLVVECLDNDAAARPTMEMFLREFIKTGICLQNRYHMILQIIQIIHH